MLLDIQARENCRKLLRRLDFLSWSLFRASY